jgi:hypothetical protein
MHNRVQPSRNVQRQVPALELEASVHHRCDTPVHFGSVAREVGVEAEKSDSDTRKRDDVGAARKVVATSPLNSAAGDIEPAAFKTGHVELRVEMLNLRCEKAEAAPEIGSRSG